ncbi:MAG: hypothetical protein WC444_04905 [Candidatus Paceibacterota bacterium]
MTPSETATKVNKVIQLHKDDFIYEKVYFNPMFTADLYRLVPELEEEGVISRLYESENEDGVTYKGALKYGTSLLHLGKIRLDGEDIIVDEKLTPIKALVKWIESVLEETEVKDMIVKAINIVSVDRQEKYLDRAKTMMQQMNDIINSGKLGVKEYAKLESLSARLWHSFEDLRQNLELVGGQTVILSVKVKRSDLYEVDEYLSKNYRKYLVSADTTSVNQTFIFMVPHTEADKLIDSGYFEDMVEEISELHSVEAIDYDFTDEPRSEKNTLRTNWVKDYDI